VLVLHQPCGHTTTVVPTCSACRGVVHHVDLTSGAGGHPTNVLP